MSIMIRGVDKPECCADCPAVWYRYDSVPRTNMRYCGYTLHDARLGDPVPSDCPIIQLTDEQEALIVGDGE